VRTGKQEQTPLPPIGNNANSKQIGTFRWSKSLVEPDELLVGFYSDSIDFIPQILA
jgi:hypothetical protein